MAYMPHTTSAADAPDSSDLINASTHSPKTQGIAANTSTSFLSLSAELRNHIYELALVDTRLLFIMGHGRQLEPEKYGIRAIDWDEGNRDYTLEKPSLNIKLLQANRQINSEAAPILYGQNHFLVDFDDILQYLSIPIISQIRHLKLSYGQNQSHLRSTLAKLRKSAPLRLQKIEIAHNKLTAVWSVNRTRVAKMLLPLMRDMVKARGAEALEALELFNGTFGEATTDMSKTRYVTADTQAVRKMLADMLEDEKINAEAKREAKSKLKGSKKMKSIPETASSS